MTKLKEYDSKLMYGGKHFASIDGFMREIAIEFDLDQSQLEEIADQLKREGKEELLTRPEVLAELVKTVDEQTYRVDTQDVEDVCNGVDCQRRRARSSRSADQDMVRFEEDDLIAVLSDYFAREEPLITYGMAEHTRRAGEEKSRPEALVAQEAPGCKELHKPIGHVECGHVRDIRQNGG